MTNKIEHDGLNLKKLGEKIRNRRQFLKLSQQEVLAGQYSEAYLSRVEGGKMQPSAEFLNFIAERLDTTPEQLETEGVSNEFIALKPSREFLETELKNARLLFEAGKPSQAKEILLSQSRFDFGGTLLADYLALLGEIEIELADISSAVSELKEALRLNEGQLIKDSLKIIKTHNLLGEAYFRQRNYLLARQHHQTSHDLLEIEKVSNPFLKMRIYFNLATDLEIMAEAEKALVLFRQAARLLDVKGNSTDLANIYRDLALAYRDDENFERANLYFDRSHALYKAQEDLRLAFTLKGKLGKILLERQELEEAKVVLEEASKIADQLNDDLTIARARGDLADLERAEGKLEEALRHLQSALETARWHEDPALTSQLLGQLAEIHLAWGATEESLSVYEEALEISSKIEATEPKATLTYKYALALEKSGKLQEALAMHRKVFEYMKNIM